MADVTIAAYDGTTDSANIQLLARGAASADIVTAGATVGVGETFEIAADYNDDLLIFMLDTGGGTVVTFDGGVYPGSNQAALGDEDITIASADGVLFVPQAGRHVGAGGSIFGSSTQEMLVWVFRLGAGFHGIEITNRTSIPAAPTS